MSYLWKMFLRDLVKLRVQFIAVFMMSVLAITIFSGMVGVWYGLQQETNDYYKETNLADAWVNGLAVSDDMIRQIEDLDSVKGVEKAMTVTDRVSSLQDKADMKVVATNSTDLFNPVIRSGSGFDSGSNDKIWIDETFADKNNLKVGDTIELEFQGRSVSFEIAGTILDSEFIYYRGSVTDTVPNHKLHGYAWISEDGARRLYGAYVCNELRLSLTGSADAGQLEKDVENILGDSFYSFSVRDDLSSVSQIDKEINQMQNMANLFSAVFIVLAVLCMYSTMSRIVNNQAIEIGTMKALGFSNAKIRLHYACYGFFVSLLGSLIGIFFGLKLVSRAVMKIKKATLTIPEWKVALSPIVYLVIAGIVIACVVATLIAVQRYVSRYPAEVMRNMENYNTKHLKTKEKPGFLDRVLSIQMRWMIRDNKQNIVRWIISVIGVAGSMVLMMAGLGFRDSINSSNEYVFYTQYTSNYKVVLDVSSMSQVTDFESHLTGDYQREFEYSADLENQDGDRERRTIEVVDEGDFVHLEDMNGNPVEITGDTVAISRKLADKMGVGEGDTIRCRILGDADFYDLTITDIVKSPSPQGVFLSDSKYEEVFDRPFLPNTYLLESSDDLNAIKDLDQVKESIDVDSQLANMQIMTKSVMTIIYLMITASVLLGCIIIYNLGMLSFIERYRAYATMKVLGYYQKEIRGIIICDCMITTVLGWLIGIPCGRKFLSFYIGIVQFKTFEWVPTLTTASFLVATLVVFACALLVNLFVAHKVNRIQMVEALKSAE